MFEQAAKIMVEEINSVDRIQAMVEGMHRLVKEQISATFGIGCGNNCDAWGIGCGNNCLTGLEATPELIKGRYAIDVLGKKGIKAEEMTAIRENFEEFHEALTTVITEKLSLERMDERIKKYGR